MPFQISLIQDKNRKNKDGTIFQVACPKSTKHCNTYMGVWDIPQVKEVVATNPFWPY